MQGRVDVAELRRNGFVTVRRGALLCERLSTTASPVRQRHNRRDPERHGFWAFPWPHFDMFYAVHQFEAVLPKRLRPDADPDPDEVSAWIAGPGRSVLRRRRFWWPGPCWSRLSPSGEYQSNWFLHHAPSSFGDAVAAAVGPAGRYGPHRFPGGELVTVRYGVDYLLELFLPSESGQVVASPYDR